MTWFKEWQVRDVVFIIALCNLTSSILCPSLRYAALKLLGVEIRGDGRPHRCAQTEAWQCSQRSLPWFLAHFFNERTRCSRPEEPEFTAGHLELEPHCDIKRLATRLLKSHSQAPVSERGLVNSVLRKLGRITSLLPHSQSHLHLQDKHSSCVSRRKSFRPCLCSLGLWRADGFKIEPLS